MTRVYEVKSIGNGPFSVTTWVIANSLEQVATVLRGANVMKVESINVYSGAVHISQEVRAFES